MNIPTKNNILVGSHGLHDPVHEVRVLCVNTWVAFPGTPDTPAHDANKLLNGKNEHIMRYYYIFTSPQTKGPPLSPWQESFPPSSSPAQIMESATVYPLAL